MPTNSITDGISVGHRLKLSLLNVSVLFLKVCDRDSPVETKRRLRRKFPHTLCHLPERLDFRIEGVELGNPLVVPATVSATCS
jgi:hypothetical protein